MEKTNKLTNTLLIISFAAFIFFWDESIVNFQIRFLILIPFVVLMYKNLSVFLKVFNIQLLPFFLIFVHMLHNLNYNFIFFNIASFFFLVIISIVVFFFREFIILNFLKIIYLFIFVLLFSISLFFFLNYHIINYNYIGNFFQLSKLIFKENSHLGMMVPSIIFYFIYKSIESYKYIAIAFIIFLFVTYVYSLTVFLGLILSSLILIFTNYSELKKKHLILSIIFLTLSLLIVLFNSNIRIKFLNSNSYVADNIIKNETFSLAINKIKNLKTQSESIKNLKTQSESKSESKTISKQTIPNLSIEVYMTSIKITFLSLIEYPLGVGLNNYKFASSRIMPKINTHHRITKLLNLQDGANNFAKIVTEFGLFSIFLIFFVYRFIFSKKIDLGYKFLIIPNLITQTFVRGAGYFNGGYLFFLLLLVFIVWDKELKNINS